MADKDPFDIVEIPASAEIGSVARVKIREYNKIRDRDGNLIEVASGPERNVTLQELQRQASALQDRLNIILKQITAAEAILTKE